MGREIEYCHKIWYKYIDHLFGLFNRKVVPMGIDDVITRVERAGDANRKTLAPTSKWLPRADSPLWGVYARYCEARNQEITAMVGRCHFWHVILILAPLRWLYKYLSRPTQMSFPAVFLLLAIVAGLECLIGFTTGEWWALPGGVAIVAGIVGVIGGLAAYVAMVDDEKDIAEVLEFVVGEERFSWGAIALLLCGPAALIGLFIAFLIHAIARACGWISDELSDGTVKVLKQVPKVVFAVAVSALVGWGVYEWFVQPLGWLPVSVVIVTCVVIGALTWHFRPQIGDFVEAGGARWEARHERLVSEAAAQGAPPPATLKDRIVGIGRGIVTALCVVRDLFRLVFTAVVYGYKQVCDLAPVPEHLLKKEEAATV